VNRLFHSAPKASWAGLICRTCIHLKRQILPHNGQLNVPADQSVKLETDLGRKGLEEKMSFKTRNEMHHKTSDRLVHNVNQRRMG